MSQDVDLYGVPSLLDGSAPYATICHNWVNIRCKSTYDSDGDDDVVAQSWASPFFSNFIIRNDGGEFEPVALAEPHQQILGGMAAGPLGFQGDGSFELVITDSDIRGFEGNGIDVEENFIAVLSNDLSTLEATRSLPPPYFEAGEFAQIKQVNPGWEGSVGLSHDVAAWGVDVDHDDDTDIVIGSMIWSDEHPMVVLQILINHNGIYVDETDQRLFNWLLVGPGMHRIDFVDVNGDEFVDILVSDHGAPWKFHNSTIAADVLSGSRVLVNDGTGHFAVIVHQQIASDIGSDASYVPWLNAGGRLRWTTFKPAGDGQNLDIHTRYLNQQLSTGPNGLDPAEWGAPGYNEFFYILHNEDVRNALATGEIRSGLEHYLAVGRDEGRLGYRSLP